MNKAVVCLSPGFPCGTKKKYKIRIGKKEIKVSVRVIG